MVQQDVDKKVKGLLQKKPQENFSAKMLADSIGCAVIQVHKTLKTLTDAKEITMIEDGGEKKFQFGQIPSTEIRTESSSIKNDDTANKNNAEKKRYTPPKGRDTTKYKYKGVEYAKGRFCLEVLRDYINKKKPSLDKLEKLFPAEIVQKWGVFALKREAVKLSSEYKRYFLDNEDVLKTSDGQAICVTNQWTVERLEGFIGCCLKAGIDLEK